MSNDGKIEIEKVVGADGTIVDSDATQMWTVTPSTVPGHFRFSMDNKFLSGDSDTLTIIGK